MGTVQQGQLGSPIQPSRNYNTPLVSLIEKKRDESQSTLMNECEGWKLDQIQPQTNKISSSSEEE